MSPARGRQPGADTTRTDSTRIDNDAADLSATDLAATDPDSALSYEQARDELAQVVGTLESGGLDLEESLTLWERGEKLARRCEALLDGAQARVRAVLDQVEAGEFDEAGDGAPAADDESR